MDNFLRIAKVEDERITLPEFINPNIKFTMISSIDIAKMHRIFCTSTKLYASINRDWFR